MEARQKHKWNVTLQAEDGAVVEYPFSNHWDPNWTGGEENTCADEIARTAAAQASREQGKDFAPIAAALVS